MASLQIATSMPAGSVSTFVPPERLADFSYPSLAAEMSAKIATVAFPGVSVRLNPATGFSMASANDSRSRMGQLVWNRSDVTDFLCSFTAKRAKLANFFGPIAFASNAAFYAESLFEVMIFLKLLLLDSEYGNIEVDSLRQIGELQLSSLLHQGGTKTAQRDYVGRQSVNYTGLLLHRLVAAGE